MALQTLRLVAPSGGHVRVDLSADAPVSNVVASVRFAGGSYGTGFQIGTRGQHDFAATYAIAASPHERFMVHGREVMVAEADDRQSSFASLVGPYHELMTVYSGPAPRRERIFALFHSLNIQDAPAGMTVRTHSATLLDAFSETLVIVVKDRGSLTIPSPRQALTLAPRHAGARTRNGEVWRAPFPGARPAAGPADYSYLVAFPAGLAEVHLRENAAATEAEQLAWLDDLNVAWRAA
jgi:hypothetical protein